MKELTSQMIKKPIVIWYNLLIISFLVLMYDQVIDKAEYSKLDRIITNILLLSIVGINLYAVRVNVIAICKQRGLSIRRTLLLLVILFILGIHSIYLFDDSMKIYGVYNQVIDLLKSSK